MNIGSLYTRIPGELTSAAAEALPDRIRQAHRTAKENPAEAVESARATQSLTPPGIDPVGNTLRAELQTLVEAVVQTDSADPPDLLGEVIELVVSDRFAQLELQDEPDLYESVCEKMRSDPAIVAELDDILRAIARDLIVEAHSEMP